MSVSLSPARARQLISVEDVLLEHRKRTNHDGWQAAVRWLADRAVANQERLAVLEARVADVIGRVESVSQCWRNESVQAGFHPPSGTMHAFLDELRQVLKGGDQ